MASAAARASTIVSTQVSRWPRESAASNARDMARAASSSGEGGPRDRDEDPWTGSRDLPRPRPRGAPSPRPRFSRARSRPYFAARTRISVSSPRRPRGEADRKPRERRRGSPRAASRSAPRAVGGRVSSSSTPEERRGSVTALARTSRRAGDAERVARRGGDASRDARAADAAAPRAARGRHVGEPTTTTARPSIPPDGVARRFPAKTLAPEPLARLQPRRRAPLAASATPDGDATAEAPTLAVIVREKSVWMRLSEPPFYPFSWFRDVASK